MTPSPPRTLTLKAKPYGYALLGWLTLAMLFSAFALAPAPDALAQQPAQPPAKVRTATAEKRMLSPQVQVPGTVVSRNDSRISAEISGQIAWIAEVGDTFEKGDVIARIDDRFYRAEVKRLEADLAAKANTLKRVEELAASQFSSQSTLDQARAEKEMAEAQLDQARHNLERTKIRAPFAGVVVERMGQLGEYASLGTVIARLVDTRNIEVSARVPISSAPYLDGIETVYVTDGSTGVTLPVRTVVPVGDERSRQMEIRVGTDGAPWVVGTAVKVDVPSGPARQAVAVPRDALILRPEGVYVFVINGDETARRVPVRLGAASGEHVEVIGEVAEGSPVVVRGGERLREGQKVAEAGDSL